jgi:glycosyltransferase involved in cell wall biosynthesis
MKNYFGRETCYVFSDDGSADGSADIIKKLFSEEKYVVLGDGTNHGPGYAFNLGFEWILQNSTDYENDRIISIEADCTADLSIVHQMLLISDIGYDLVLASVYSQGGGLEKTTFLRKFLSFFANMFLRLRFDIRVLTLSSFYRLYSVKLVKDIRERYGNIINESGYISMIEILIKAIKVNAKIIEVPVRLLSHKRVGSSKMKILKTFINYVKFLSRTNIK